MPNRVAFIHIVRTGGTFLNAYVHDEFGARYAMQDSWRAGLDEIGRKMN